MYFALFLITLLLMSITMHTNRVPLTPLTLFIVVVLSAIPVLNVFFIILCFAEIGLVAYRLHLASKGR